MNMRKGISFLELIAVLVIFPAIAIGLDGLFRTILVDVPRAGRVVQENTSVLDFIEHIQEDIDHAKALPDSFAGCKTGENVLLIELADEMICYELTEGLAVRRTLGHSEQKPDHETSTWSIPNAHIRWQVWKKEGAGYAVEIENHIRHKHRKKEREKMAGVHVYFVNAL
ncbi:MAG: hypothetical protein JW720_06845 [Sedimentisphaerales bacterium]|nr:hypothetical protein [Sedimentisphaerales bacterium]